MTQMIILKDRLIGFFDVLGFSKRLETQPLDSLHASYSSLIDQASRQLFTGSTEPEKPNFAWSRFIFDSVVLVSRSLDDVTAVSSFLLAATSLMRMAFTRELPMRGCIGVGDFLEDSERGVFYSDAFPKLVRAEKEQEWTGCFVHPDNAEDIVSRYLGRPFWASAKTAPCQSVPMLRHHVPGKQSATIGEQWCLNWPYTLSKAALNRGLAFLNTEKRAGTESFVDHLQSLPDPKFILKPELFPAACVTTFGPVYQFEIHVLDAAGEHVDPPKGSAIQFAITKDLKTGESTIRVDATAPPREGD